MKTTNCIGVWFTLAVGVLFAGAGPARATFTYDFEGLSNGAIEGQPGWSQTSNWQSIGVADGPAGSADVTKVLQGNWNGPAGAHYSMDSVYFTSADTAAQQSFWVYNGTGDIAPVGGATFSGVNPAYNLFGIQKASWGNDYFYYRDGHGDETFLGSSLAFDHWYEVKLTMNFATEGGVANLYARDITGNETAFTKQPFGVQNLYNLPMYLAQDTEGRYEVTGFGFRMDVCQNSYVDNYSLSSVPEPGPLALLVTGLLGVIVYALRKKK